MNKEVLPAEKACAAAAAPSPTQANGPPDRTEDSLPWTLQKVVLGPVVFTRRGVVCVRRDAPGDKHPRERLLLG